MRKTVCMAVLVVLLLTFLAVGADGCARTSATCPTASLQPFMGLPNDQQLTLGEASPDAPRELHDTVVVTRVEHTGYGVYAMLRDQGRITREEERDNFRFYAVEETRTLFSPGHGEVNVRVTRRYSTRVEPMIEAYAE
jgi:hypothetical protein